MQAVVSPVTKAIFVALFLFPILLIFYVILWYICGDPESLLDPAAPVPGTSCPFSGPQDPATFLGTLRPSSRPRARPPGPCTPSPGSAPLPGTPHPAPRFCSHTRQAPIWDPRLLHPTLRFLPGPRAASPDPTPTPRTGSPFLGPAPLPWTSRPDNELTPLL
ncbi:extensin-like, partial [Trichechus manatus latirostris]|uniref:Extensin-like n=1 Tax=Trichechus manatus latirostris TaxID=127582 RepID=A0A2Y9G5S1_TRIMA